MGQNGGIHSILGSNETVSPSYYSMASFIFHLYVSFIAMRDQVAFF
jgi:hypothetical protein